MVYISKIPYLKYKHLFDSLNLNILKYKNLEIMYY